MAMVYCETFGCNQRILDCMFLWACISVGRPRRSEPGGCPALIGGLRQGEDTIIQRILDSTQKVRNFKRNSRMPRRFAMLVRRIRFTGAYPDCGAIQHMTKQAI